MYEKETNLVESNFCFVTNGALSWLVAHIFFAVNGVKCAFDEKSSFKNIDIIAFPLKLSKYFVDKCIYIQIADSYSLELFA